MREVHGVADAIKKYVGGPQEVKVTVTDEHGEVYLQAGDGGAYLTPDAARFIASYLVAAADRVESARVVDADENRRKLSRNSVG